MHKSITRTQEKAFIVIIFVEMNGKSERASQLFWCINWVMFVHSRTLTMVCTDERAAPPPPPWRPSPQNATWATNPRIAAKPPSLLALHRRSMLWCRRPLSFIGQHEDHGIRPVDHALEVGPRTTRALFESSHYSLLATSEEGGGSSGGGGVVHHAT